MSSTAPWPVGPVPSRRWIDAYQGDRPGPTLVVIGGLHGNEPAGVVAIGRVLQDLRRRHLRVHGRVLGLVGNTRALDHGVRYLDRDLNRAWASAHFERLERQAREQDMPEDVEQRELSEIFTRLERSYGALTLLDLHSFSAEGPPFSVAADTLRNWPIAHELRAPVIFGLDEIVEGSMLGYLVGRGHVGVGFEGGQHEDPRTVENHVAALWQVMVAAGLIEARELDDLALHERRLARACAGLPRAVEIIYRHAIRGADAFKMDPGFFNFQRVRWNQRLAVDTRGEVRSPASARMLMPLYQGQGSDGFFLARDLEPGRLRLYAALRRLEPERLLTYLPGVELEGVELEGAASEAIRVPKIADRPAIRTALRMLGYRRELDGDALTLTLTRQPQRARGPATRGATGRDDDRS